MRRVFRVVTTVVSPCLTFLSMWWSDSYLEEGRVIKVTVQDTGLLLSVVQQTIIRHLSRSCLLLCLQMFFWSETF